MEDEAAQDWLRLKWTRVWPCVEPIYDREKFRIVIPY